MVSGTEGGIAPLPPNSGYGDLSHILEVPRYRAVFGGIQVLAGGDRTVWLGMSDSNSETSSPIIPLKSRVDLRGSSRISAHGDHSRLSCGVEDIQLGPRARISA